MGFLGFFFLQGGSGTSGYFADPGLYLKYCEYDSSGTDIGCNSLVLGSITTAGGAEIAGIRVEGSGNAKTSGTLESWSGSGNGKICYAPNSCDPFTVSASGDIGGFALSFSKSKWTSEELEAKWGSDYGAKQVSITVTDFKITAKFQELQTPVTKSYAYSKSATFNLQYGQSSDTSTSTTTSNGSITTTTTTSTSTTLGGGLISNNSTDTWGITVGAASGGITGNEASNGIIVTLQKYQIQGGFTVAWVWFPSTFVPQPCTSGQCGQLTVVTKDVSVTVFAFGLVPDRWVQLSVPVGTNAGDLVLAQVTDLGNNSPKIVFSQALTVSPITTNAEVFGAMQLPPEPYTGDYYQWGCSNGAISEGSCIPLGYGSYVPVTTTTTTALASDQCVVWNQLTGQTYTVSGRACILSIVSVTF